MSKKSPTEGHLVYRVVDGTAREAQRADLHAEVEDILRGAVLGERLLELAWQCRLQLGFRV